MSGRGLNNLAIASKRWNQLSAQNETPGAAVSFSSQDFILNGGKTERNKTRSREEIEVHHSQKHVAKYVCGGFLSEGLSVPNHLCYQPECASSRVMAA